ncbi:GNAT family N-acetyltransferase [Streptomyces sp. HSW2009]|uniref:GNAT family N-acetyltransferase n=1 Tax=Streptomyces sp. HSW2009 TaxID=3142890 RepID=UPI0032F0158A
MHTHRPGVGAGTAHPDNGTGIFLYELSVDPAHRRHGAGGSPVRALREWAQRRGRYGMRAGTEHDNAAALATHRATVAADEADFVSLTWSFRNRAETVETAR